MLSGRVGEPSADDGVPGSEQIKDNREQQEDCPEGAARHIGVQQTDQDTARALAVERPSAVRLSTI